MNLETETVLCLLLMLLMFSSLRSWVRFDFFLQTPFQNITWTGKYLGRKRGKKVPVDDPRSCFVVWLSHFSYIPLWLWRRWMLEEKYPSRKKKKSHLFITDSLLTCYLLHLLRMYSIQYIFCGLISPHSCYRCMGLVGFTWKRFSIFGSFAGCVFWPLSVIPLHPWFWKKKGIWETLEKG